MNNALYDKLPAKVRALVDECTVEAIAYGRSLSDQSIAADKKVIEEHNVEIITLKPADLEIMKEKAAPVYKEIRAKVGDELVDTFLKAIEKAK